MGRVIARALAVGLLAGCSVLTAACGEKGERLPESGASLEGTVKYGSEPVHFALVIAVGPSTSASGKINEDGRYKIENVPLGEVKIAVNTDAGRGDYMTEVMSKSYQGPDKKGSKRAGVKFLEVPKKYHDPETSGLKTTVNKGPNTFDIVIPK